MLLTHCQDHILTENVWILWSRTSYSGGKWRCYRCGTDVRTTTNEQGKIELLSQWMLDGWVSQFRKYKYRYFSDIVFQFTAGPTSASSREREREKPTSTLATNRLTSKMILLIISIFFTVMITMMVVVPVENLALSLLLAKFFALLAIFLCQLLFPNKQQILTSPPPTTTTIIITTTNTPSSLWWSLNCYFSSKFLSGDLCSDFNKVVISQINKHTILQSSVWGAIRFRKFKTGKTWNWSFCLD